MEVTDKNLCRICLYSQSKLYFITDTELQEIYEKLTDIKILTTDVHQYVCFLCYTVLRQCRKLKQQAIWSEKLLKENANASIEINHTFRLSKSNIMTVDIKPEFESGVSDVVIKREVEDIYTSDVETHTKNDSEANEKTDSEDDIPLKNISSKNKDVVGKRKERIINAKEIILSHEEQLQEMMERSKSENYTNSPYKCDLCYKGFIDPTAFDKHKEKHDKISGPYKCGICHLRYPSTKSLRAHTASTHSRRYQCDSRATLGYHQRRHTGEKPFPCDRCPATFSSREYLRVHSRSHSGERPYVCALCGHAFSQKPALNRHYRVHTGARPYACHLCSKSFSQSNSLKVHINTVHLKMPKTKRKKPTDNTTDTTYVYCFIYPYYTFKR
ncbi:Myoneurin [Danaus plexippus plexippus]|uniref:Myoneurin n=1 Tax=Danaus plexippus plexippus TaxID=278856 RepID=A0A212ESE3_DANPL|nr:Myoneurin [Danaus plexippus plexippus]